ncbi:SCO1664 family protein [Skermania piniformis]|uniref:SCO1664 family protein n=1 Tax=Skermania pinensis TaxID=39122 RepID=A0ABX8SCP3_9ACTN|nr:SCO1664 family protein [Skermania piniformis]QXQ15547.1 SCO1664 family protein [Skermania piniformis]
MTTTPTDALRTGDLTPLGRIPTASNATLVCEARSAGDCVRCVYKPVRGERPLWDFPDGTLAGREFAAYLISEALDWGVVPETVLRDGPFGLGMVQRWVDIVDHDRIDDDSGDDVAPPLGLIDLVPPDRVPGGFRPILRALAPGGDEVVLVHADDPRLQRMAVLDVILNNADRKGGHALDGTDGRVYGVDHGICLHVEPKLRTVLWGWAGEPVPEHLLTDLSDYRTQLDRRHGAELAELLTGAELDALAGRVDRLLTSRIMPLPPEHRPIPWPAF